MIHLMSTIIFVYPQSTKELLSVFKGVCVFQVQLEFGSVGICGGCKAKERQEKPLEYLGMSTNHKHVNALQMKDYQLNTGV